MGELAVAVAVAGGLGQCHSIHVLVVAPAAGLAHGGGGSWLGVGGHSVCVQLVGGSARIGGGSWSESLCRCWSVVPLVG